MKQTYHVNWADGTKTADVEFTVHGGSIICKHKNIHIVVCHNHACT
jgi:hypothetical protein